MVKPFLIMTVLLIATPVSTWHHRFSEWLKERGLLD